MASQEADTRDSTKRRARPQGFGLPEELRQKIAARIEQLDRASRRLDEAQRRIARQRIARY